MRKFFWLTTLSVLFMGRCALAQFQPEVVYGDDDRLDLYQVKDARVLKLADSTVALFEAGSVSRPLLRRQARLATQPYGKSGNLCKEEPFYDQETGAFCSGSLIAPDIIMTAGHCVKSAVDCRGTKFVFGFGIKKAGQMPKTVPASEVYGCAGIIARAQENAGADWALIKLDRIVKNHAPLALHRTNDIANGAELFVIGHPAGLPTKVAGGARARDVSPQGYFVANLDTYGGNSGSAVFNAASGLIEGILVRGEVDYVEKDGCRVSNKCPVDGCRGEDVTKMSAVIPHIPPVMSRRNLARAVPLGGRLPAVLEELGVPDFDTNRL